MVELDRQDTYNKIVTIIAEKLSIDSSTINSGSTLQDLGADSLDMVEIIMRIEEQLGVTIDDEKAEQLNNINDVVDYVHSLRIG